MKKDINKIKIIILDVDGVLTDGTIVLGHKEELKFFNVYDGMGITLAKTSKLKVGIITGRESYAVERRGKELGIDYVIQGSKNKLKELIGILDKEKLGFENVCYVGDDIIDISIFRKVNFSATVANAPDIIKKEVCYISRKSGGDGAVREIIEHILRLQGKLDLAINNIIDYWSKN